MDLRKQKASDAQDYRGLMESEYRKPSEELRHEPHMGAFLR
jgi:hypothetical protein